MRENLYLNHVVPECQIEQSQQREENANIDLEGKILMQIYMYGSLLEGKRHQSLVKPDKSKFLNELKRIELAKQKHGVNTIHVNICDL